MPYRKPYQNKPYKRPRQDAHAASTQRMARAAAMEVVKGYTRDVGYYGRYNNAKGVSDELKWFDFTTGGGNLTTNGVILDPTVIDIPQNATESGRIGRKITIKEIHVVGDFAVGDQASTACSTICTLMMYQDKQCNGATAVTTDLIEDNGGVITWAKFNNLVNKNRFHTIAKIRQDINPNITWNGVNIINPLTHHSFEWHKKVTMPVEYDGATGAITELRSNNIGMYGCDSGGIAAVGYIIRIRYRG